MKTSEKEIKIPEVKRGRCVAIDTSQWECKVDPRDFQGKWIRHAPTSRWQEVTISIYWEARLLDRLHPFTFMTIAPSVEEGKLVYKKGLPIKTGFSQREWEKMMKDYSKSRNSRQMTLTEYVCRNLFIIKELVSAGCKIDTAWEMVCDDSSLIGHYRDSPNREFRFEPTGSREVHGWGDFVIFHDLGNAWKFIAKDPWDTRDGFWMAGGGYGHIGKKHPISSFIFCDDVNYRSKNAVSEIALDY